jgi:hypothetical protein
MTAPSARPGGRAPSPSRRRAALSAAGRRRRDVGPAQASDDSGGTGGQLRGSPGQASRTLEEAADEVGLAAGAGLGDYRNVGRGEATPLDIHPDGRVKDHAHGSRTSSSSQAARRSPGAPPDSEASSRASRDAPGRLAVVADEIRRVASEAPMIAEDRARRSSRSACMGPSRSVAPATGFMIGSVVSI